ncbi:hypothetical protein DUNSADRAFT_10024 [Dunaliella salina]|uniref:Encoded protein n=1 Tax=Dunaliella salina TaxID=3046 RepID=A0ABQ7GG75_DUNSA|nr:hypothetical protein DUNSADRAFT_10024 [Dunaliella salina]|eukprot:KAF5833608.1 hypothetical protein DUNSADRAFT_10024 [Dunaliella salina]
MKCVDGHCFRQLKFPRQSKRAQWMAFASNQAFHLCFNICAFHTGLDAHKDQQCNPVSSLKQSLSTQYLVCRSAQLTKAAFGIANHTVPEERISVAGTLEEKELHWEMSFKESHRTYLKVLQDLSRTAGPHTARAWLNRAIEKEVPQKAGAPGQLCKYFAYCSSYAVLPISAVLTSLTLLSTILREPPANLRQQVCLGSV